MTQEPGKTASAEVYNFGHDINGNPTSHFTLWMDGKVLFRTRRRVQCGYAVYRGDGAMWKLNKLTGKKWAVAGFDGRRSDGSIAIRFNIKN